MGNDSDSGNRDLQHFVSKAMQDLDETKRSNAESAKPSAAQAFAKRAALVATVAVSIAAWVFVIAFWARASGSRLDSPNEVAARDAVAAIVAAESTFRENHYHDANGDGVAEYGKLHQLADPSGTGNGPPLVDARLASAEMHGYVFTVLTRDSAPNLAPAFRIIAAPLITSRNARVILADDSGIVQTRGKADVKLHDVAAD